MATPVSPLAQVWTDVLMGKYREDGSILNEFTSFDHLVKFNSINMSEVGADPEVVENAQTYPLTLSQRSDKGYQIALNTFDTKPTLVTNVEEIETNYDKAASVLKQHSDSLVDRMIKSALYNIAPSSHSANTPVLSTTGTANSDSNKKMTYADILRMRTAFNKLNIPQGDRVMILCPIHEEELLAEDAERYNQMMTTGQVAGFKVYVSNSNPYYSTSGSKSNYGVTNTQPASIFFSKSEVMRAIGDINCKAEERWADFRGYAIGAQVRFAALPIRDLGIGAIWSKNN